MNIYPNKCWTSLCPTDPFLPPQVPLESRDARGRTAMHYAAASGDAENVQWLIRQGRSDTEWIPRSILLVMSNSY